MNQSPDIAESARDKGGIREGDRWTLVSLDDESLVEPAGQALIEAFFEDPLLQFLAPEAERRRHLIELVYPLILKLSIAEGQTYIVRTLEGEVAGTIALIPPRRYPVPTWRVVRHIPSFVAGLGGLLPSMWSMLPGIRYARAAGRLHVAGPHWFVMVIGVAPRHQGQGVGRRLMERAMELAEADGYPLYLETESVKNVSFYEHLGFEILGREQPHPGGPKLFGMMLRTGTAS